MNIQQGSIVLINFDPSVGQEIQKVRPALVLQNNLACEHSPLITVVPISSRSYAGKVFEVLVAKTELNGLLMDSVILINQLSTFDKQRAVKIIGQVENQVLSEVWQQIDIHFDR